MNLLSTLRITGLCHGAALAGLLLIGMPGSTASAQQNADSAPPAAAEMSEDASGVIEIELNRLEQRDKACRLSFVYRNLLGTTLDALQLEAVLFDQDERVERFIVLSSKSLPESKVRVQQFDIGGLECNGLGSILVNDVKACEGEGLTAESCLAKLSLSSKAEAKLLSSVE